MSANTPTKDRHSPYRAFDIAVEGQVATVRLHRQSYLMSLTPPADVHRELGPAFAELRTDDRVRIIVITGSEDGEFLVARPTADYAEPKLRAMLNEPSGAWKTFMGIIQCHQVMAEIEKPIVARVNGDAIGFGQSIMFASDMIIAVKDARICDVHLAMGEASVRGGPHVGPPFGTVPGDGAGSILPLLMPLHLVKQYLWFSEQWTAADFAERGLINRAVSQNELDAAVANVVSSLLARSSYALAWSKRLLNRQLVEQLNRTLDASVAYEMVNLLQIERLAYSDPKKLS